jgi:alkylhydroperoxidase/carboxymuconolactone decarboxylase family protein YurZ
VLRLTGTDRSIAEIAAIAEHVASLTAAAAALRLCPDVGSARAGGKEAPLVSLPDAGNGPDADASLAEIHAWSRETLAFDGVPDFWRALAHQPRLLAATWRKDRLVLGKGAIDELVKTCAALAVAQFRQSDYWICYFTEVLRRRNGFDDATLVELAGTVMHYVSFNTIAHGMRLDAPVAGITAAAVLPGGHLEHVVPGARRREPSK